jgi:hypothetical protein
MNKPVKIKNAKKLNANVWGKHYWFFLHTVAYKDPEFPNSVIKRKYYDLISNFPLFIPDEEMGNRFASLLDKYPVTPYLDSRESFIRWCWFIHNKINRILQKDELEFYESIERYFDNYNKTPLKKGWWIKNNIFITKKNIVFLILLMFLIFTIVILQK